MSDHPQQPSNTSSAGQSDNAAPADARAQAGPAPPAARPLRGMASMRGAASLRGGLGRGASVSSSASMVPSRSSYASPAPGAAGSAGPGSGVRMQFRPVMPQRRKASASPAPTSSTAPESSTASPLATPGSTAGSTRGGGRGRGRGGARPPRQPTQMTASGPFALGPSARPTGKKVAPIGPGGSSLTPAPGSDSQRSSTTPKPDPDRASYRNPDKLKDAEQYSDPEDGGVEIVDMDEVHILDELAPRALPRVAEKASKKDKQKAADARQKKMDNRLAKDEREAGAVRVKSEDDETMPDLQPGASSSLQTSGTSTAISSASVSPQPEEEEEERGKTADALDLSESEGEELMDDLVDDFVFHDDDDASPENRLYLFQFPQLFPKFKAPKKSEIAAADAAPAPEAGEGKESSSSKRRSVSFAEGTTGGAGKARPTSVKDEVAPSSEIDDDSEAAASEEDDNKRDTKRSGRSSSKEGLVGKLNVYRDGRVFLHFGELVMEVTGGSQSTFLQQVMLLDPSNRTATALGELHRKFIVSPELDCMLNDIKLYDQEQLVEQQRIKKEQEDKEEADRLKYGASAASFNAIGR